jgi:hypothetical protein
MNERTTIVVCYKEGTMEILQIWFSSVIGYTRALDQIRIVVVTASDQARDEALEVSRLMPKTSVVQVKPLDMPKARIHGAMLDAFLVEEGVGTEFLLTMDSDCFPVADGWLENGLVEIMDGGARVAGILHPWAPPPADMDHKKIEWRVRSQHCWDSTHVACQMIRMEDLNELQVTFAGGDDTGLLIPLEAKKRGWKVDGFQVTRCAKPEDESDPEFNRYVCLIFGDAVYHHGGFTRVAVGGDKPVLDEAYGWVRRELMNRREAEFLLHDEYSYRFKFDREEAVAQDKMDRLFGKLTMARK